MKSIRILSAAAVLSFPIIAPPGALAHLTYGTDNVRDFGIFSNSAERLVTLANNTKSFGWADGTDADFAAQDAQRYFRFTLQGTTTFTISVIASNPLAFFPAFSIYQGLGHAATDPAHPDHDNASVTQLYLDGLGAPDREGAFDALHTWKIGNSDDVPNNYFGSLVTLTYMDNAADGDAANYGNASAINGDGVADGAVTRTFTMPAGDYTLAVGGANYFTEDDVGNYTFSATVSAVPEPSSALLIASGLIACAAVRHRRHRGQCHRLQLRPGRVDG